MPPEPTRSPSPRRRRVGLRALMLGIAALAVVLALWVNQAHNERLAARWIEAHGGRLMYEDQLDENGDLRKGPEGPVFVPVPRQVIGDEYFRRIGRVKFPASGPSIPPDGLSHLSGLSGLRWLILECPGINDRDLAHLGRMDQLDGLELEHARLTDEGLRHLAGLGRLRHLDLKDTPITDAGLAHLRGLRDLTELELDSTKIAGPGLAHLAGLVRLEWLSLNSTPVDDAGLALLPDLPRLENLCLGGGVWITSALGNQRVVGGVTDAGLRHLQRFAGLKWLQFTNSRITGTGLDRLLPRLPRLEYLGLHYTTVDRSDYDRIQKRYPRLKIDLSD